MAINPGTTWPTKVTPADPSYPYASSLNESVPGANDGTPYEKIRADDVFGMQQALLQAAAIVPSGSADTALNKTSSQYMQAALNLIASATTFADTGTADAYVLGVIGANPAPASYRDGASYKFLVNVANTGASTVNIEGIGVKGIFLNGAPLLAGALRATHTAIIAFDDANDRFNIVSADLHWSAFPIGSVIARGFVTTGATSLITGTIPPDDSIPQITEGSEVMSLSYTPKLANSRLIIEVVGNVRPLVDSNDTPVMALFRDSVTDAMAAVAGEANTLVQMTIYHEVVALGTSPVNFTVRMGGEAGEEMRFNGDLSSRLFGGVHASTIKITEVRE